MFILNIFINRIWTNLSKKYIIQQNERDWQPAENLDTLLWMDQLQRIHGQPQILELSLGVDGGAGCCYCKHTSNKTLIINSLG